MGATYNKTISPNKKNKFQYLHYLYLQFTKLTLEINGLYNQDL
jgi:hypothetical protein